MNRLTTTYSPTTLFHEPALCVVPVLVLTDERTEEADDARNASQFVDGEVVPVEEDAQHERANVHKEEGVERDNRNRVEQRFLHGTHSREMTTHHDETGNGQCSLINVRDERC